jgi:hypothetical protein
MEQEYVLALSIIFGGCGFVTLWIWMVAKRTTRRPSEPGPEALMAFEQRLARLEVAVDDMSAAFGRVAEGQQFLTKLLAERSDARAKELAKDL